MDQVKFDIWSVLILFGAFHGLYLGLMLLLKKENRTVNRIFGFIIFIFTLHLFETASWITGIIKYVPHLSKTTYPFLFLMGPLLYFYGQSLSGKWKWNWPKVIHLLPALGFFIYMLPYYFLDSTIKLKTISIPSAQSTVEFALSGYAMGAIFYLYNFTYIYLVYRNIKSLIKSNHLNKKTSIRTRWFAKVLVAYGLFICSCLIFYFAMALTGSYPLYYDYIHLFLMALMIHVLGYFVINQPVLFVDSLKSSNEAKYDKSDLPSELSKRYLVNLNHYFEEEQPYLKDNLDLNQVAEATGISKHHLSLILNKELGSTFYDYINRYRVETAKSLMKAQDNGSTKLIDIGFQAGFGNKVSFYRAFKKFEGTSPSEYMTALKEGS